MWAGGLEVGRLALGVLVDVQRMLARWQALDVQLDFYSVRSFAEHGGSDVLTLGVFDFHGNRFGRGGAVGLHNGNAARQDPKAHNTGQPFQPSLLYWVVPMVPPPPRRYPRPPYASA